jgi:Domain of unknown function (DUF4157)
MKKNREDVELVEIPGNAAAPAPGRRTLASAIPARAPRGSANHADALPPSPRRMGEPGVPGALVQDQRHGDADVDLVGRLSGLGDPGALGSSARRPVQRKLTRGASEGTDTPAEASAIAAAGTAGTASPLPFLAELQRAMRPHDVSSVRAHIGGHAAAAAARLNADAYASGEDVVLPPNADLRLVAHEAAHVLQQRSGVVAAGLGAHGDAHERHADAIADRVVRGEPVGELMAPGALGATASAAAVQRHILEDGSTDQCYAALDDARAALFIKYPVLKDFAAIEPDVGRTLETTLSNAFALESKTTLKDVATTATPHIAIGERHTAMATRTMLMKSFPQLRDIGVTVFVAELMDGEIGKKLESLVAMYASGAADDEAKARYAKLAVEAKAFLGMTLEACLHSGYARASTELKPYLVEAMEMQEVMGGRRPITVVALALSAIGAGLLVKLGDIHCGKGVNRASDEALEMRDPAFAATIATAGAQHGKTVTLIGGAHLKGGRATSLPAELQKRDLAHWKIDDSNREDDPKPPEPGDQESDDDLDDE